MRLRGTLRLSATRWPVPCATAGCGRGDRVAFVLPKCPRTIAAMIGILKAGCAYVPIDPAIPGARFGNRSVRRPESDSDRRFAFFGSGGARFRHHSGHQQTAAV